jgi:DNA primase
MILILGRIVLCLDNDDAGIAAMERVCGSMMLSSIAEQYIVDIRVATLPKNIKDPAEFIELHSGDKKTVNIADAFRSEVLDTSLEWTDWYLERLMARYDATALRSAPGSFGDVFERVANFLATFKNAADRTKRACEAAVSLANILAKDSGKTQISDMVKIQLESDLVDRASRIANAKDAVPRRIESTEGGSDADIQAKLASISRGNGFSGDGDKEKLSWKSSQDPSQAKPKASKGRQGEKKVINDLSEGNGRSRGRQQRTFRPKNEKKIQEPPPLTPHFSGFDFAHQSDQEWLGLSQQKVSPNNGRALLSMELVRPNCCYPLL